MLLAVTGLAAVFLVISAPFIWWPGPRRLPNSFRVRCAGAGSRATSTCTNVIGIVALVPLLVWGLTGLNFEIPGFRDVWDAVTGGQTPPDDSYTMETFENPSPPITLDQAMKSAQAQFPGARVG